MLKLRMLNRIIDRLTPTYNKLKNSSVFYILLGISFFVRFPFFFRDYIDRDESTFILVAQSWVEGHLPFTELWDLKPPITFAFFAAIIYVFGKSFIAIRFAGVVIVAITAFFSYLITKNLSSKKVGLWVGSGCVLLLSMFGSLQGVMSEHIGVVLFMPALYLLIKRQQWPWIFLAGLLMGLSVMTKLNIAYVVLALGIFLCYVQIKKKAYVKALGFSLVYGLGILTIICFTFLPYYFEGQQELWWRSVVLAPLEYANARRYSILSFAPISLLIAVLFYFSWRLKYLNYRNISVQFLTVAILGILFSFIKGGRINGHYLIQLHPVLIILTGICISKIAFLKKVNYRRIVVIILLLLPAEAYLEYVNITKHKLEKGSFFNGEGITVPKYIKEHKVSTDRILFLGYHIGYWMLDTKPLTKAATHPSNICRSELFPFIDNPRKTGLQEITYIMSEIEPQTVVLRKNKSVFDPKLIAENEYVTKYLAAHYTLLKTVDKAEIYVRLK